MDAEKIHFNVHVDEEFVSFCKKASEEDLQILVEYHKDSTNDARIELYIYLCLVLFGRSKDTKHLEQIIQRTEGWVAVTPAHHPDYNRRCSLLNSVTICHNKAIALQERYREKPAVDEIGIQVRHLYNKASSLREDFEQYGRLEDLEEAIETTERVMNIAGYCLKSPMFLMLGILLNQRYKHKGSINDLHRAVRITEYAVTATPQDDPCRTQLIHSLGNMLSDRFERTGSMDDLNQAISKIKDVVDASSDDYPHRDTCLCRLGALLGWRFKQEGLIDDLNQAVRVTSDAVDAAPDDSIIRAVCLINLGNFLCQRFKHRGLTDDLNRAIIVATKALDAMPDSHPQRPSFLSNLGICLGSRFQRTKSINDLNQAISVTSHAVDATPRNDPFLWKQVANLGKFRGFRFFRTGSIDDLNQAVSATNDALDRMPRGHPERATCLSNLGILLSSRFEKTGLMDDLDRSISVSVEAVDATLHGHPEQSSRLRNLGLNFGLRFKQLKSADDLDQELSCYIASWNCVTGPPFERILPAQIAAKILIQQQDWEKAYQLLHDATLLLPTMSPRSLNPTDTQDLLGQSEMFGLASSAAAVALQVGKTPGDALRLLELGRGVIASLLVDMRGGITELQLKHPDLAEKFSRLREELDSPAQDTSLVIPDRLSSWELQIKRRREADEELSKTIDVIRTQPNFSQFLQPPAVKDLMNAANQGPIIVVNISSFRSDAFLIQPGSTQVVNLPGVTLEEMIEQVTRLHTCLRSKHDISLSLEWLWHNICRPCLDALGFTDPVADGNWPHVWWVPTGLLSQMPLHAAGIYKQASKETVLDRVISSYASSIKALLHGRKGSIQKPSQAASLDSSALIIAMQDTPGLGQDAHLQFVNAEIDMLQSLCPKLQLTPNMPQRRKDEVLEQLRKCKLFHFAGHGRSDPNNPSQSCLLLEDWETNPLTVGAVRDSRLQEPSIFGISLGLFDRSQQGDQTCG